MNLTCNGLMKCLTKKRQKTALILIKQYEDEHYQIPLPGNSFIRHSRSEGGLIHQLSSPEVAYLPPLTGNTCGSIAGIVGSSLEAL